MAYKSGRWSGTGWVLKQRIGIGTIVERKENEMEDHIVSLPLDQAHLFNALSLFWPTE